MSMTIGEYLDKATGLMEEAKSILNNPEVRARMIANAYLGEMSEKECLDIAIVKAEEAIKIIEKYMPQNIDTPKNIYKDVKKRVDELIKPHEIIDKSEPEPIIGESKIFVNGKKFEFETIIEKKSKKRGRKKKEAKI